MSSEYIPTVSDTLRLLDIELRALQRELQEAGEELQRVAYLFRENGWAYKAGTTMTAAQRALKAAREN